MTNKIIKSLLIGASLLSVSSCGTAATSAADSTATSTEASAEVTTTSEEESCLCANTLDDINAYLNDSTLMNMNYANVVAVIPFNHINGPRNEWKFYALVNFQYKEKKYVKYQITYLSCTCRAANVNYWQTAYVELTLPQDGQTSADTTVRKLSFDADGTGYFTAGFWGDSDPIYNESTNKAVATYDNKEQYPDLPSIKEDFIPLIVGKTRTEIDSLFTTDDMTDTINGESVADAFAGASVSTNNIIRMLQALFSYHATEFCGE